MTLLKRIEARLANAELNANFNREVSQTTIVTKAQKYDEIVRLWNATLSEDNGEVWYLIALSPLVCDIQDVIKDDITEINTS